MCSSIFGIPWLLCLSLVIKKCQRHHCVSRVWCSWLLMLVDTDSSSRCQKLLALLLIQSLLPTHEIEGLTWLWGSLEIAHTAIFHILYLMTLEINLILRSGVVWWFWKTKQSSRYKIFPFHFSLPLAASILPEVGTPMKTWEIGASIVVYLQYLLCASSQCLDVMLIPSLPGLQHSGGRLPSLNSLLFYSWLYDYRWLGLVTLLNLTCMTCKMGAEQWD